jgi:hypothetical protein
MKAEINELLNSGFPGMTKAKANKLAFIILPNLNHVGNVVNHHPDYGQTALFTFVVEGKHSEIFVHYYDGNWNFGFYQDSTTNPTGLSMLANGKDPEPFKAYVKMFSSMCHILLRKNQIALFTSLACPKFVEVDTDSSWDYDSARLLHELYTFSDSWKSMGISAYEKKWVDKTLYVQFFHLTKHYRVSIYNSAAFPELITSETYKLTDNVGEAIDMTLEIHQDATLRAV